MASLLTEAVRIAESNEAVQRSRRGDPADRPGGCHDCTEAVSQAPGRPATDRPFNWRSVRHSAGCIDREVWLARSSATGSR